jgi:glycosyltransferase involved in cell wall biosynthesis
MTEAASGSGARPLNILSVCRSLPTPQDPSSGIFVLNRLAALSGIARVRIVQPVPWCPQVAPLPDWARTPTHEADGVEITHAPMFYVPRVLKSLDGYWLERSIARVAKQTHARAPLDLIDAHFGYPEGVGSLRVARRLRIPLFITIRGFENEYLHKPIIGPMLADAMRSAAGIVSVSHSLRELAIEHGVEPGKVRVVHNAIERSIFHPGDASAARARLGFPTGRLIVSVGHLISRKRHHVLIEAFARVRARYRDATLAIIGAKAFEPDYPAQLAQIAQRMGVGDAVRFVGNVPPQVVADWLRVAAVFALGTAREGCCNAVLEALGAGVPVVTTPVGDNAHFVKNGANGFLVPVDDAPAMAEAIASVFGREGWDRERISAELAVGTWQQIARDVLDFFEETLARRNGDIPHFRGENGECPHFPAA